jgi:hypothetical protein
MFEELSSCCKKRSAYIRTAYFLAQMHGIVRLSGKPVLEALAVGLESSGISGVLVGLQFLKPNLTVC